MKKRNRFLCFLLAFSMIFSSIGLFAYAVENQKNYYYLDSVNGDDSNSGTDYSDINSFKLSADSPLIGAGLSTGVETDFYGNPVESNNIGCYGGTGTDTEYKGENIFEKFIRTVINIFQTIKHEIEVIFD